MRVLVLLALVGCDRVLGLAPSQLADTLLFTCPAGYASSAPAGGYYRLAAGSAASIHWDDANSACLSDQTPTSTGRTHLVVIDSAAELAAVHGLVGTATPSWIGLTDRPIPSPCSTDLTTYAWITDEPVLANAYWVSGQPAASCNNRCVVIQPDGTLATTNCDQGPGSPYPFVCECDEYPQTREL